MAQIKVEELRRYEQTWNTLSSLPLTGVTYRME